jgi:hypothetical protein
MFMVWWLCVGFEVAVADGGFGAYAVVGDICNQ